MTPDEIETLADSILKLDDGLRALKERAGANDLRLARFESGLGALELRLQRLVRRLERIEGRLDENPPAPHALAHDPWPS